MSQHDMDVANGPGLTVRTDMNLALQALASQSSGAAAPGTTFPCQVWADTGAGRLRQRNSANTAWIDRGALDSASFLSLAGGTMSGAVNDAPINTIASATLTDIGAATSNVVAINGTATIASLGAIAAGARRTVCFLSAMVLTHNATSLILPGSANITTAVNDTAEFLSLGGGNWICLRYSSASGAYSRTNSVGTVSQAGGVPTGAIIESGSNSNGDYSKWADGTMICTRVESSGRALAGNLGAVFIDVIETAKPYSQTFVGVPREQVSVTGAEFGVWWMGVSKNTATLTSTGFLVSPVTRGFSTFSIVYSAKGRWF